MTLIAIACKGDYAEFVTDSMAYKRNLGQLCSTTKSLVLHHLDAAVLGQGDGFFTGEAKALMQNCTGLLPEPTFDALLQAAPEWLSDLWAQVVVLAEGRLLYDSTIFLVGYSHEAGEFAAYLLASERDFEPERLEGVYMTPTPGDYRPHDVEALRILRESTDSGIAETVAIWQAQPARAVPDTFEDWALLGFEARTRATQDFAKVLVGGSLYLTTLKRDVCSTVKMLDFDDTGEELLKLVGYSQHPASQARPCWCESGKTHLECHLAVTVDEPCGCGAPDKTFRDCCMVV